jgi:transcriptional regulator of acetoin/glycerol metabolism
LAAPSARAVAEGMPSPGEPGGLHGVPLHSEREKQIIATTLARTGWNRSRAARQLGVDRTTLWRKIREYGLQEHDWQP